MQDFPTAVNIYNHGKHLMNKSEILYLLKEEAWEKLAQKANARVLDVKGTHVNCRGLIEVTNICRRNCLYCGLAAQNRNAKRYKLTQAEIMDSARRAVNAGMDTIVLQGGEGAVQRKWLAEIITDITKSLKVPVTLSFGECSEKDYEFWRLAGASRYLLKHETADPLLYAKLHPGYTLADRIKCLNILKQLDYEVGDGFMVGLPGQSLESYAEDILLAQQLKAAMCGVGPFIPHHQTALASAAHGSVNLTLRILAILRLALPNANLPATTALATLAPEHGQTAGLLAGANVLMPGFTPPDSAVNYLIYDNKTRVQTLEAAQAIEKAGRTHCLRLSA